MKFDELKKRFLIVNNKGTEKDKTYMYIVGIILVLYIAVISVSELLPAIISNMTNFGVGNISTGILANGSSCILENGSNGFDCVFAVTQTQGGFSVALFTVIIPLLILISIFLGIAKLSGLKIDFGSMK